MDFFRLILGHARLWPHRPAVASNVGVATYAMLAEAAVAACSRMEEAGLTAEGGIVAVDVRNPLHHLILLLALGARGIPSLSVQTNFPIAAAGLDLQALLMDRYPAPPGIRGLTVGDEWWTPSAADRPLPPPSLRNDALCRVVFSSGTTGQPKPLAMSLEDFRHRFQEVTFGVGSASRGTLRILSMMGFSTVAGYIAAMYALSGGGMICFAEGPRHALEIVRVYGVGQIAVSPIQLQALVQEQNAAYEPCPSLHLLVVAGGWTSPALIAATRAQLTNNVVITYGSTETGTVSVGPAGAIGHIDGAAGYVLPWMAAEIVDADGRPVPRGTVGEIRVRGPCMLRYLRPSPETERVYRDGWAYLGDAGLLREDGLLLLAGRSVDLMNRGGVTVAPDSVEAVLRTLPGVLDAGVFSLRVPSGTEEIWAAVVAGDGFNARAALAACRARLVEKAPDRIVAVDAIPRNDMGKVVRRTLREAVVARLGTG